MKKKIIILIFLSLVFSFILFPLKAKAQGCIVYDSGIYPATYGFEKDINGNEPVGWFNVDSGTTTTKVIESLENHRKVVEIVDNDVSGRTFMFIIISPSIALFTIEFWYRTIVIWKQFHLRIYDDSNYQSFRLDNVVGVAINTWHHFRYYFDTIADTYSSWLDGVRKNDGVGLGLASDDITRIVFASITADIGYITYLDAIGISTDTSYNIGDNRFPLSINQEAYQPTLAFFILIILMSLMFFLYMKLKKPELLILVIFLFSLIIGIGALMNCNIPFTPYIQIFFILFQLSIFILTSLNYYKKKKRGI